VADVDIEARLIALAKEMKKLIAENFLNAPVDAVHERLDEIRIEIYRHGWNVTWNMSIDPAHPDRLDVQVDLWKPKPDMTPEEREIYDEWFRDVNDIQEGE
jgi:hypothetical protein